MKEIELKTEKEVTGFLQGKWISEDGKVSFEISEYEILNVTGLEYSLGIPILGGEYSLDWGADINHWKITNIPILQALRNAIIFEESSFSVMRVDAWPLEKLISFHKTTQTDANKNA